MYIYKYMYIYNYIHRCDKQTYTHPFKQNIDITHSDSFSYTYFNMCKSTLFRNGGACSQRSGAVNCLERIVRNVCSQP